MSTAASEPPFTNLIRQVSKLSDQVKGYYNFCGPNTWTPAVNLYESETTYLACIDLAGVDKEKIDVEVVDNRLTLSGRRDVPVPRAEEIGGAESRLRVHLMEIDHGSFCRDVELPDDVDREHIAARYRDGMLWIEIPKK